MYTYLHQELSEERLKDVKRDVKITAQKPCEGLKDKRLTCLRQRLGCILVDLGQSLQEKRI